MRKVIALVLPREEVFYTISSSLWSFSCFLFFLIGMNDVDSVDSYDDKCWDFNIVVIIYFV